MLDSTPCQMPLESGNTLQACGGASAFVCLYVQDLPHIRHYRCLKHRPPTGEFARVERVHSAPR